jgi:hypothetical protein
VVADTGGHAVAGDHDCPLAEARTTERRTDLSDHGSGM